MSRTFIERFRETRRRMWTEKPREIAQVLDKTTGRTDIWGSSFFPTLYAWEESVAARNAFLTLRKTLLAGGGDLGTMKAMTGNLLELYASYFAMTNLGETTALLREAALAVKDIRGEAELRELLEELVRYCGRLHYWIEPIMPWEQIVGAFEQATAAES